MDFFNRPPYIVGVQPKPNEIKRMVSFLYRLTEKYSGREKGSKWMRFHFFSIPDLIDLFFLERITFPPFPFSLCNHLYFAVNLKLDFDHAPNHADCVRISGFFFFFQNDVLLKPILQMMTNEIKSFLQP